MSEQHERRAYPAAADPPAPPESLYRLRACEYGLHDDHDTEDGCVWAIAGPVVAEVLGQLEERRMEGAGPIARVVRGLRRRLRRDLVPEPRESHRHP